MAEVNNKAATERKSFIKALLQEQFGREVSLSLAPEYSVLTEFRRLPLKHWAEIRITMFTALGWLPPLQQSRPNVILSMEQQNFPKT
jgi:hypothetical protein